MQDNNSGGHAKAMANFKKLMRSPLATVLHILWSTVIDRNKYSDTPYDAFINYVQRCQKVSIFRVAALTGAAMAFAWIVESSQGVDSFVVELIPWTILLFCVVALLAVRGQRVPEVWDMFSKDFQEFYESFSIPFDLGFDHTIREGVELELVNLAKRIEQYREKGEHDMAEFFRETFKVKHERALRFGLVTEKWDLYFKKAEEALKKEREQNLAIK